MKKHIIMALFLALLVLLMAGCGKDSGESVSGSDTVSGADVPVDVITGDPTLRASAKESTLPQFGFCHIYGDVGKAHATWLWNECIMRDVKLISVSCNTLTGAVAPNEDIFSFGDVFPGEAVLLFLDIPELNPAYALTCVVGGQEYAYVIGYDKESGEATLSLIENTENEG